MLRPLLLLPLVCCACRTTTTSTPANSDVVEIARTEALQAWELREGTVVLGSVVRYADRARPELAFFGVRDVDGHDLGMIDRQGRAWRYRPHRREPEWLGTGTILKGARLILGGGAGSALAEIELAELARGNAPGRR